jgi:hypothetical protein
MREIMEMSQRKKTQEHRKHTHTHTRARARTHMHTRTHTRSLTHTHTHTHTHSLRSPFSSSRSQIGVLDPNEPAPVVDMTDPYSTDPHRHPGLLFHSTKPANAELPADLLMDSWITPNDLFFIRHHHPVPVSASLCLPPRQLANQNQSINQSTCC